jgi:hypothetical protein
MGMLDRYRKTGGFIQLVTLLETCGPTKQEKFLEIIRQEEPIWAETLKTKVLDINRIFSWRDDVLAEVVGTLQDLCLAVAIHAADEPMKARFIGMLSHGRRRKIDDLLGRTPPTPAEVTTMHMKIVETVRKMAIDGFLRFEKFDIDLLIEDGIEEKLDKKKAEASETNLSMFAIEFENAGDNEKIEAPAAQDTSNDQRVQEISLLRKKLAESSKEVAVLRHELSIARGKLDQIKKIA